MRTLFKIIIAVVVATAGVSVIPALAETGITASETTTWMEREVWSGITGLALALTLAALILTLTVEGEKNRAPSNWSWGTALWTVGALLITLPSVLVLQSNFAVWHVLLACTLLLLGIFAITISYRATVMTMAVTNLFATMLLLQVIS